VSVAEALREETELDVLVKWPNDLLVGERKLGGFLVETTQALEVHRVVLGVGLNVGLQGPDIPGELAGTATSLSMALGRPVRRHDVLRTVAAALERCFDDYELECIVAFRDRWRGLSSTLGSEVTIAAGAAGAGSGPLFTGTVTGLAESGALVIRFASGGTREIWFGDVTLRNVRAEGRDSGRGSGTA
jgi:BirA family biotin operon repressor/biotin-[acetyl-CoA-carboxylase] ligase